MRVTNRMTRRQNLAAVEIVLSALGRDMEIEPEIVVAYVAVGGQNLATMTPAQFNNSVRIAVESIDLDPPVTHRRILALAAKKRKESRL